MLKQSTKQFDSTNSWADILKTLSHVCNSHAQQKLFVEKLFNLGGGNDGVFEQLTKKIVIFWREISWNVLKKYAAREIKKEEIKE